MKKRFFLLPVLMFISLQGYSQRAPLSLSEAILGPYGDFAVGHLSQASWRPGTHQYTWVNDTVLLAASADHPGIHAPLLTLEALKKVIFGKEADHAWISDHFPEIHWVDKTTLAVSGKHNRLLYDLMNQRVKAAFSLPSNAENIDLCAEGPAVAYTRGNNLFVMRPDGQSITVTHNQDPGIVSGQFVSRNEFGIYKGTFWSPSGRYLAYYTKDERKVTCYPLVNTETRIATVKEIRYPMAGMASEQVSLLVYDLKTGKTIRLDVTGDPEQYLTNITWGPGEKYLYVAVLNRDQDHMWFNQYEVSDGKLAKTLFEETDEAYVEPLVPARFLPEHPDQFIWESRRGGYNQVFLYNTDGKLLQNLTPEKADVETVVGFLNHDRYLAYTSASESPLQRHLILVDSKKGKRTDLTPVHGMHRAMMSEDGAYFSDTYSNLETPRVVNLIDKHGKLVENLLTAENPWKDRRLGKTELGKIEGKDGDPDLYYRLIKPVDFDPSKKYPVIIYVYGGPHSQLVTDSWLGQSRMWQHYMAGKGYVAFTLDNRGTLGRGFDFEKVIHRHLGRYEVSDQMRGVAFLKTLPWVDSTRIGVHGWSFGGFMTLSMMLKHPGVCKVAVAGGPVTDWKYYEVMYGERYMDTPEQNPEGFKEADLKNYVNNLEGKCLIINGAMDSTVVWQNSLTLLRAFIKAGKQVDYFVYPSHPHNVRGVDRVHLMRKISDYFDEYLKEED